MRSIQISLMLVSVLIAGCGVSGPPTAPVSGVVTYEGKPVQYAKVMFFPQGIPDALTGFAQTDAEGRFTEVISGTKKGAFVGHNFVTITEEWPPDVEIPESPDGMQKEPPRGPWDQKYRDSTDPALKVDIVADGDNYFEFEISE